MTEEQLIERIRTGLKDDVARLHPPADLLERLRAVPRARRRRVFWVPARAGGAVAFVASVAVVAIVVVVFVSLGHGRPSPTGSASVPAAPRGARSLVARLAVLRRPQTAADRLPASLTALIPQTGLAFRIIPGLTRLAATVKAGSGPLASIDIYVVVGTAPGLHADIATALAVAGPSAHRYLLGPPGVVEDHTFVVTGGLIPTAVSVAGQFTIKTGKTHPINTLTGQSGVNVSVVPDGVTRVRWIFKAASPGSPPRDHRHHGNTSRVTVSPQIKNNVAVAKATRSEKFSAATWYGRNGRAIATP